MKVRRTLVYLVILLLPSFADASETKTVSVGDKFSFAMESNPTTGFQWHLAKPLDETVLRLDGNTYAPKTNPGPHPLVGVGGTEIWTFEAIGKGASEIYLQYVRPWEKGISPSREMIYSIIVE